MMRQSRVRNVQFFLNLADEKAIRVSRQRSNCIILSRGSVPIAESMSAYLATCSAGLLNWILAIFP